MLDAVDAARGDATQIGGLLESLPGIRLLVTAREPLLLDGERAYRLRPLRGAPAAELFRHRAERDDPRFEAAHEDLLAICTRLDGLPRSIEAAAARVKTVGVEGLLAELDDGRSRRSPPRAP